MTQLNLFNHCHQCGSEVASADTIVHVIHRGRDSSQYHFCSQSCQQHFAQAQMRRLEGNQETTRAELLSDIARRLG